MVLLIDTTNSLERKFHFGSHFVLKLMFIPYFFFRMKKIYIFLLYDA